MSDLDIHAGQHLIAHSGYITARVIAGGIAFTKCINIVIMSNLVEKAEMDER